MTIRFSDLLSFMKKNFYQKLIQAFFKQKKTFQYQLSFGHRESNSHILHKCINVIYDHSIQRSIKFYEKKLLSKINTSFFLTEKNFSGSIVLLTSRIEQSHIK